MRTLKPIEMQGHILAPRDGTAQTVHVFAGDRVANGELLVALSETDLEPGALSSTDKSD